MAKNDIQYVLDKIVKKKMKQAQSDWYKAVSHVNNELYEEAINLYDSMIEDFYSYKTKSYIRHEESRPGTMRGINLYRGQNIKKIYGKSPKLIIDFNASDMDGYKNNTAIEVLNYVMHGIRYYNPNYHIAMTWKGNFIGKYFTFTNISIDDAFYLFDKNFENLSKMLIKDRMKTMGWG